MSSSTPSGSDNSVPTTPATPAPDVPQPEAPQPEVPQPDAPQPEAPRPEAPQPGTPVPPLPPAAPPAPEPPATTGAHAAPRPYPPSAPPAPPAPEPPATTGGWTTPSGFEGAAARERPRTAEPVDLPAPATDATPADAPTPAPAPAAPALPEPPRKPGFGRHALGTVVGLLVTPFALLLIGIGASGLRDLADDQSVAADWLSLGLLLAGVAVLAAIVLLGSWSPALPITGGLVWGVGLGIAYLAAPWVLSDAAAELTSDGSVPKPIQQLADAATSGYLLTLGVLLVTAGIAAGVARRNGRRWAEAVVVAERALADHEAARP